MKRCPRCKKQEWDYDVCDGIFTWCGDCHHHAKVTGFYDKLNDLLRSIKIKKQEAQ